ncbi:hypothetical protein [Streptomyces cucumeris]|uniref:hypothetical protein n=1 Tax=Streptomyces cucumeris TaxID=2962890 RepID=UPI003D6FB5A2
MRFIVISGGDEVAIMKVSEALVAEGALSLYVAKNPDSGVAIRILWEVSSFNEPREARMEDEVERACA